MSPVLRPRGVSEVLPIARLPTLAAGSDVGEHEILAGRPQPTVPDAPVWLNSFCRWAALGVLERQGDRDHPLIVEMLALVGLPHQHDETPWCSAAMNAAMHEAGLLGTRSARARSWEGWGQRLLEPRFGCVAVLQRGGLSSGKGHVACWVGEVGDNLILLGGNQHNQVRVSLYPAHRLLSYRWPDEGCLVPG